MIFSSLYAKMMQWAIHPHAERYLAVVSMFESIFLPIPTAFMVAPMAIAKPDKAIRIALIATIMSVLGGIVGYYLGYFVADDLVVPLIKAVGYWDKYLIAQHWFNEWGFWAVVVAGFSPIPFKLFTLSAGAMSMAILPFIIAAFIGRGLQFFLVALLMAWAGPKLEPTVRKYIEWLGWLSVAAIVAVIYFHT